MRPTAARAGPVAVSKYLLPREVQVATVRRHPAILIGPTVLAVGGLLVAAILSATVLRHATPILYIVWLGWVVLLLRMIWFAANWAVDYFVVTSERMLLTSGLFSRKVAMMPLTKVTDMSFRRSFAGRLLGYGEFIVESAGQDQAFRTVDHIPYPEQLYLLVCGMLFPTSADEEDDDETSHDGTPRDDAHHNALDD
jgi:Bacterial PH domain